MDKLHNGQLLMAIMLCECMVHLMMPMTLPMIDPLHCESETTCVIDTLNLEHWFGCLPTVECMIMP